MRYWLLLSVALALGPPATLAGEQRLFDGHSLAGWQPLGDAQWTVRDGAIEASGAGDGLLATTGVYGDFTLTLEFRVDATTNSGVFIGCRDVGSIHPDQCYEVNIWDQHPQQQARTGAIVNRAMPPRVQLDTVDRWNVYEISSADGVIRVRLNGQLTALLEGVDTAPGLIALQHFNSGTVRFRNIRLQR